MTRILSIRFGFPGETSRAHYLYFVDIDNDYRSTPD